MQSATFGVNIPREFVFPRRKVFFGGLPLWSFRDSRQAIQSYYGDSDVFTECVGHMTFHRQERKFSNDEASRFQGRVPCTDLANHFSFASMPVNGWPDGVDEAALLRLVSAWLRLQPEPRWELDPDGALGDGLEEGRASESWRSARDQVVEPLKLGIGFLRPLRFENVTTTRLSAEQDGGRTLHFLSEVTLVLERPLGARCEALFRMRPIDDASLDTQLLSVFAEPATASVLGVQLLEGANGNDMRFDVPSCVCRHRLGGLALQWVAEESR